MVERKPAEVFPPGVILQEELEQRGLTKYITVKRGFLKGKVTLDRRAATALGEMFVTSASYWQNSWWKGEK